MRILVTGAEGFVGSHLQTRLTERGHEVVPTSISGDVGHLLRLPDEARARALIEETRPEAVVHLAAVAHVPDAQKDPGLAYRVNVLGTAGLFAALSQVVPESRFVLVSTAAVYGDTRPEEQPLTESVGALPVSAYGWSKLGAECALQAGGSPEARWVIARPFTHTGPGQEPHYALPAFARQIVDIEQGKGKGVVRVGNLEVRRDVLDVRDVVEAYVSILETPNIQGVFNVASGTGHRLRDLLDELIRSSSATVEVAVDPARLRAQDPPLMIGDAGRLRAQTGWEPAIPIETTLRDLLESMRTSRAAR